MSDNIPTSPPEGQAPVPTAPGEPSGAAAVAPSPQPSAPAAISSPPATGSSTPPASTSQADLAFAALMADPAPYDNPLPVAPAAPAPPAPEPPAQVAPSPPPASDPPASEHEEPDPTPAETQEGKAPVKKLVKALRQRSEFRTKAEAAEQALTKERALTDRVLNAFDAAGIDAQALPGFMANLAKHRNDPAAQAQLLASLGVQAPTAKPGPDLAAVRMRLEAYDAEGALALLNAMAQPTPAVVPPPAQPQAQPVHQQPREQSNVLKQTVQTMGAVLRDTYGEQEASKLADLIDTEAKARVDEMEQLDVVVTPEAAAKIWRKAQGTVLRAQAAARSAPPASTIPAHSAPSIRPAQPAPPRKLTADEAFAQLQAQG